jgi:enoyl-CoA hydratase/carnithine racemase
MNWKTIEVDKDDRITWVYLNRPDVLNALNRDLLKELAACAESLSEDYDTRAVIFSGKGPHFSCGADLKERYRYQAPHRLQTWRQSLGKRMIKAILNIDQITIAAINGYCLGGAACIATACDIRIGAADCKVGYPEINLGMNLQWLGLPLAVRLVGPSKAKRLVIGGNNEDAETLLQWGFLDEVVPQKKLYQAAKEMALHYAEKPPIAAQMIKRSVNIISNAIDEAVMHMDHDQNLLTATTEDLREAMTAFHEKRKPEFKGN